MNLSRKALFVTHEGFGNSIFRSQVIEHCETLLEHGYIFDILTYETFKKSWLTSLSNNANYVSPRKMTVFLKLAINIYYPGSTLYNLFILARDLIKLKSHKYEIIHARADYTAFLCLLLKPLHRLPVVWDCRGDSVDELKFAIEKFSNVTRKILYFLLIPRQILFRKIVAKFCSGCICVSDSLYKTITPIPIETPIEIIPCPVPVDKFFFSNKIRNITRAKMGVDDEDLLYIYSGSMTGYQSINDFLWYYDKVMRIPRAKLVIATVDIIKAKKLFKEFDKNKINIITVKYEEVNNLYCAADFAFMARIHRNLNMVASPTKFGEYCLSGLKVIHNCSVDQVVVFTNRLGNGCDLDEWPPAKLSANERVSVANSSKGLYGRGFLNSSYLRLYENILGSE